MQTSKRSSGPTANLQPVRYNFVFEGPLVALLGDDGSFGPRGLGAPATVALGSEAQGWGGGGGTSSGAPAMG